MASGWELLRQMQEEDKRDFAKRDVPDVLPTQEEAREQIDKLNALESGLTDYEVGFLKSVGQWEGEFTPKQLSKIGQIANRLKV